MKQGFDRWLKNLAALCIGLVLLALVELVLGLAGVTPLSEEDRFVGFAGNERLFVPDDASPGQLHLNPIKAAYFNQQSFAATKPAGTFRIVVLGGSTVYGRPWLGQTAFAAWLKLLLEEEVPDLRVDLINAGGISYASYRLKRLLPELLGYAPDLVVLYAGHNEFLERRTFAGLLAEPQPLQRIRAQLHRSRLYSSLARGIERLRRQSVDAHGRTVLGEDVGAVLEQVGGPELYHRDEAFRAGVIAQYRYTLNGIADAVAGQGVPLVICTLPVNLSGVSPFKSEHRDGITAEELTQWQAAFSRGMELAASDPEAALGELRRAATIDPRYALLWYRIGQLEQRLGRSRAAYAAFDRAREEDIVPLRALNAFNDIIRQLADERKLPLADVEAFYKRISPGQIPGSNLFADHVHPTIAGQQIIAWSVLNAATAAGVVPLSAEDWQATMPRAKRLLDDKLTEVPARYLARGDWGVGRLYYWAGKYAEAEPLLQKAWQTIRDTEEIPRQLANLALWRGDAEAALRLFDEAESIEPGNPWTAYGRLQALLMLGRGAAALALIDHANWPESLTLRVGLARCRALLLTGERRQAGELLQALAPPDSDTPGLEAEIAALLAQTGQETEARRRYRRSLVLARHPAPEVELERWWGAIRK
jgi:tetratricopeptide (TPR) repeat protein